MIKSFKISKAYISKLLFFLIIFFLPQQFGPHFWPPFSKVFGIRVDYLSPTIYVSDILIVLLFLLSWGSVLFDRQTKNFLTNKVFLLFLLVIFIPLGYSYSPQALLYGVFKLFECLYLALFVMSQLKKRDISIIIIVVSFTGVLESLLSVAQFFRQQSIGGLLYFFGERSYHLSTIGIAAMNTSRGLLVRPYGTFPHPNILAFFLFIGIVLSTYQIKNLKRQLSRFFLVFAFSIMQVGLLLTFSRVILLLDILFLLYVFLYLPYIEKRVNRKKILLLIFGFITIAIYLLFFNLRFFNIDYLIKDILPRNDLVNTSFEIIRNYPLFGVGLNNFYYHEAELQKNFSPVYLQPVHNIFLFLLANSGFIGLGVFGYFLTLCVLTLIKRIKKTKVGLSFSKVILILLLSTFFVGLFDHFFLTTQQGELMFALILGLCWNKNLSTEEKST